MAPVAFPTLNNKEALCAWLSGKWRIQREQEGDRNWEREKYLLCEATLQNLGSHSPPVLTPVCVCVVARLRIVGCARTS